VAEKKRKGTPNPDSGLPDLTVDTPSTLTVGLPDLTVETPRCDSQTPNLGNETALKPLHSNDSAPPSYSSQITFKPSSSINQANSENSDPDDDDDLIENSFLPEPEKTNSGDDDFDLWLKTIKIPELIADGVKNPEAYLKSLDKTTGEPLVEKFREEYRQRNGNAPGSLTASQAWEKALEVGKKWDRSARLHKLVDPNKEPKLFEAIRAVSLVALSDTPIHQLPQVKAAFIGTFNALA
jgi:hypothetical protein